MAIKSDKERADYINDLINQIITGNIKRDPEDDFPIKRLAYYYSLMKFNGMEDSEALKCAKEKSYNELKKLTKVDVEKRLADSIFVVQKYLFKDLDIEDFDIVANGALNDGTVIPIESMESYFAAISDAVMERYNNDSMSFYDDVLKMARELHDKFVVDYAKDYAKGKDNGDPELYKNLPLELLGEKGLSDVMFFINPILKKMYLYSCGGMSKFVDGEYLLDSQFVERYGGYVTDFQEKNHLNTEKELKDYIKNIGKTYKSLNPKNVPKGQEQIFRNRINYMKQDDKVDILFKEVQDKNPANFLEWFGTYAYMQQKNKDSKKQNNNNEDDTMVM
jgi:hypothetical protein